MRSGSHAISSRTHSLCPPPPKKKWNRRLGFVSQFNNTNKHFGKYNIIFFRQCGIEAFRNTEDAQYLQILFYFTGNSNITPKRNNRNMIISTKI